MYIIMNSEEGELEIAATEVWKHRIGSIVVRVWMHAAADYCRSQPRK